MISSLSCCFRFCVILNVLLNLSQKTYCVDLDAVWDSYYKYAPIDHDAVKPSGSLFRNAEVRVGEGEKDKNSEKDKNPEKEQGPSENKESSTNDQVYNSYNSYLQQETQNKRRRSVRSIQQSSHNNSWLNNRVGSFQEHERNYGQNKTSNNTWNNKYGNVTGPYQGRNATYGRRRQEGMFLNTSAPVRQRPGIYNVSQPNYNTHRNNQLNGTYFNNSRIHNYNVSANRSPSNRLNVSQPFTNRWSRYKRSLERDNEIEQDHRAKINKEKLMKMIRQSIAEDRVKIERENEKLSKIISAPQSSIPNKKIFISNLLYNRDQPDRFVNENNIGNDLENEVETKDAASLDSFRDNLLNNEQNLEKNPYPNSVDFTTNLEDTDQILLIKNDQLYVDSPTYEEQSHFQKRKPLDLGNTIETREYRKLTNPNQIQSKNGMIIHRVIQREDIELENAKPLMQVTTISVLHQPESDTVLIQVPPRRITCPPRARYARGRCRVVY